MPEGVAKLKVLCARSMHQVVQLLAGDFTRETGHAVDLAFGTVGALQARIEAGEIADVMILSRPAIEKLTEAGMVLAGSQPIARTSIGVCTREGAVAPDISTPDAFKASLLAARAIAFSDAAVGGSAGTYLAGLFQRLGLADTIRRKGMPQKSGGEVAARVAEGSAEIGMTLIAEILPIAGTRVLGPLPAPLGNDTTYCAAVSSSCRAPERARAFVDSLARVSNRDVWSGAGFARPDGERHLADPP